jgi:hypothetical protein
MPAKTPAVENIERTNRQRADSFAAELKRLRQVCARAVDPGFGFHPNYDPAKYFCAFFAYSLMKGLSDGAITGTKDHVPPPDNHDSKAGKSTVSARRTAAS